MRVRLLGSVGAFLLRLLCRTWRKRLLGVDRLDKRIAAGQRTLVLFWHGTYVPLFALLCGRQACILTNRSLRGQVIARISQKFGFDTLGLPEEAGRRFLAALRHALDDHATCGTAADGPVGPCHRIKPTLVSLAAHFGYSVQLLGVEARHAWRLNGRWDRMLLPLPFARVALVVSEPLELSPMLDKSAAVRQAEILQSAMEECTREARKLVRKGMPIEEAL